MIFICINVTNRFFLTPSIVVLNASLKFVLELYAFLRIEKFYINRNANSKICLNSWVEEELEVLVFQGRKYNNFSIEFSLLSLNDGKVF